MRFSFGSGSDAVPISTWNFQIANMPTGYLNNARLTLPGHTYSSGGAPGGLCAGEAVSMPQNAAEDTPLPNAWPAGVLASLAAQCTTYNGTYTPVATPEELCAVSGISMAAAHAACARYSGMGASQAHTACLTDVRARPPSISLAPSLHLPRSLASSPRSAAP